MKASLILAAVLLLGCGSHRETPRLPDDGKVPVSITNSTNRVVKEFRFSYRRGPVGSDSGRVEGKAFDVHPNEVRWIRVDSYPEGSVRLSAEWTFADEQPYTTFHAMGARVLMGPNDPQFRLTDDGVHLFGK